MKKLNDTRRRVFLQIRFASVGITTQENGSVAVDTILVNKTNQAVKNKLGDGARLKIASFIAKLERTQTGRLRGAVGRSLPFADR